MVFPSQKPQIPKPVPYVCLDLFMSIVWAPWEVIKTLDIKNAHPLQIPHQYLIVIYIILHK